MNISGQAAVVTGGASGLGGAAARRLAQAGAKVTIFDLNEEAGQKAAKEIGGLFQRVDVADEASVEAGFAAAQDAHGVARVLVNCAGIVPAGRTVDRNGAPHSLAVFRKAIDINLIGVFNTLSKFAALATAAEPLGEERAVIINTASISAFDGQIGQAAYAASKAGVAGMTLPIARDLAKQRIRVMAIAPGVFMTPMVAGLPEKVVEALGANVPFPSRLGDPDEFAKLVMAIVDNPMLNGEVIRLDGAIRMPPA